MGRGGGADRFVRALWPALVFLVVVTGSLTLIAPWLAERMLFLPDRSDPGSPPELAGVPGRDTTIETDDGVRLHAWWWDAGASAPAVLLLHGNAGHIGDRVPLARGLVERGVSVLLLDYRGYGRSEGRPTERGLRRDARAGLAFVAARVGDPGRVVVFGRSLGGTIAADLAAETSVAGVILEATFTSLEAIAASVYPFLPSFVVGRLRGRFDARSAVERVQAPVLVVHGTRDRIVPVEMGRTLAEAAGGRAEWYPVEGADHNDPFFVGGTDYFDRLAAFVRRAVGDPVS